MKHTPVYPSSFVLGVMIMPTIPEGLAEALACNQQAVTLAQQGRLQEAEAGFRQALHLKPDFPEAHNNLGNALKDQGQLAEAMAHYQEALRLRIDYAEVHSNLGSALGKQGQLAEAVAHYQEALRLKPDFAGCAF